MAVLAMNNAWGLLSTAMTAQSNTLTLQAGQAGRFPLIQTSGLDWFYITIFDTSGNQEIVKVIATQGDRFTVARGQDGTTALAWSASVRVQLNITAGFWSDFIADLTTTANTNRNFAAPITLSGAPTAALGAATRKYITDNALPRTQAIQPPIGFSPVRQGTSNKVYFGWNGTDLYLQIDSSFMGNVWRDSTFNPATKATAGSQCQWNSGIYQAPAFDFTSLNQQVIDVGSPWIVEGYASQMAINPSGNVTVLSLALRLMWMRNQ
jgi:hypothetical protein